MTWSCPVRFRRRTDRWGMSSARAGFLTANQNGDPEKTSRAEGPRQLHRVRAVLPFLENATIPAWAKKCRTMLYSKKFSSGIFE